MRVVVVGEGVDGAAEVVEGFVVVVEVDVVVVGVLDPDVDDPVVVLSPGRPMSVVESCTLVVNEVLEDSDVVAAV